MNWPLFVTLTVQNVPDAGIPFVRKLRRDFGKLRQRKLWKSNVAGGVAAIEVTNKGHGWHPHLHALIDCKWLALRTPPPQPGSSGAELKNRCRNAKREFTELWKLCTREKHGVSWVQRCSGQCAVSEVLKYSVKGSDLLDSPQPVGPLIHQLRATRLTTSFGNLFGQNFQPPSNVRPCENCGEFAEWLPETLYSRTLRKAA
jgi:plasmid rolling circle replication initiator protein Rep